METCSKCQRRKVVAYRVEPEEAFRTVVLNRWRTICASCFDTEAEKGKAHYRFIDLEGQSWNERPVPRQGGRRRR